MAGQPRQPTSYDRERGDARETLTAYLKRPNAQNRGAHEQALDAYREAFLSEFAIPAADWPEDKSGPAVRLAG